jgi:DNA-binding NarL/FixJ family response regulator
MTTGPIKIVLADDHWLMRDEMRRILERQSDLAVVGEAENGEQALALAKSLEPDIILLDVRMPKLSGVEVLRELAESAVNTKVIILTAYDDDDYILALMGAGARGYLLKTVRAGELIDAIKRVHAGETVLDPEVSAKLALFWSREHQPSGKDESLSSREAEIIRLVATGLRNRAIAETLHISERTVEGHMNSIFNKLGVSSRVEAVLYALSRHLVVLGNENPDAASR